jgi:GalNAc-alpha-(1->4)-GalNAc-alpha-(1->3)-diNAcBac-PP-undecaprenol alpha-1,4-N-acetyl-D-galactosaminyltransferase
VYSDTNKEYALQKPPLVIALYFFSLSNPAGGAERMICLLANELNDLGLTVHLISWDDEISGNLFYPINDGIKWHKLGFPNGMAGKIRRLSRLRNCLKSNSIRILVGFVMSGDKVVYAAAKMVGVKLVVAERNAPSLYFLRYRFWRRWNCFLMLHMADIITVQFSSFANGYPQSLRSKIRTIPNPVTPCLNKAIPALPNPRGRYSVLMTGRLDGLQKRPAILVKAFCQIASKVPMWDLHIIGSGSERERLEAMVADSEFENRIFLENACKDILGRYSKAHLFVITSLWEGFPNALAEAMSAGLPVVGFAQADGVTDLIEDEKAGWLVEGNGNESLFAQTLLQAMMNHKERTRRGTVATERMKKYKPEVQFTHWLNLLNKL